MPKTLPMRQLGVNLALTVVFVAVLVSVGAPALLAQQSQPPHFEPTASRGFALAGLPPILGAGPVSDQLTSGLTTSFVISVSGRKGTVGSARIEIRYSHWDEEFTVQAIGVGGSVERRLLRSTTELRRWWRDLKVPTVEVADSHDLGDVRVKLDVLPFSSNEGSETRRWFVESLGRSRRENDSTEGVAEGPGDVFSRTVDELLASSIEARPLVSYFWSLPVEGAG